VAQQENVPFVGPRLRPWIVVSLAVSLALLVLAMGVVSPASGETSSEALGPRIAHDIQRLRSAIAEYTLDTGELPTAVFDLSEGFDGGLSNPDTAPFRVRDRWDGPYLPGPMQRPTPASFWSLAERRLLLDRDGDGEEDECWIRLHRGHGEIGPSLAAWCDLVLDDGMPSAGAVRVTPAWIWFHLLEL
jgi:hypothetical protein